MQLRLSDPGLTDRLATFLTSLRQTVQIAAPGVLEIDLPHTPSARSEVQIYLRVWSVLYPDAEVQVVNGDDDEPPPDVA